MSAKRPGLILTLFYPQGRGVLNSPVVIRRKEVALGLLLARLGNVGDFGSALIQNAFEDPPQGPISD